MTRPAPSNASSAPDRCKPEAQHTSSTDLDNIDLLDALARALVPRILPRVLEELGAERLMTATETPTPRAAKEACRRGLIRGARKLHRRWTFTAAAWAEYVTGHGLPPRSVAGASGCGASSEDRELEELRRELGFVTGLPASRDAQHGGKDPRNG